MASAIDWSPRTRTVAAILRGARPSVQKLTIAKLRQSGVIHADEEIFLYARLSLKGA